MTILLGFSPHQDDTGALELACQLARSDHDSVHAVTVVPQAVHLAVAGDTDRDFRRWAQEEGEHCAATARELLLEHADVPSEASWVSGRSVPQTLLDRAAELEASLIVVGSGDDGPHGRISLTSKTDRLLHSSEVPVAVAPRGYWAGPTARIERAVHELLAAVGEDPDRNGLLDTPDRVARSWVEMLAGQDADPAELLARTFDIDHDEMVLVKDIRFVSLCEHHLLPFTGMAHIGYIPSAERGVTGLSKLARLVELYARRLQVQERITSHVAEALVEHLDARGVIVVIQADQTCMTMRGVRKPGSMTVTSAVRGQLRDPATRAEAMSLILGR